MRVTQAAFQCPHFYAAMATTSEKPSRVTTHLRHFLRPSLTTEPIDTQAPYSYTLPSRAEIELCPPHWRLQPGRSLKSRAKAIILKEWPRGIPTAPRAASQPQRRPTMMRMKDSDDYITARAANPWTGLISPSVGSASPRTPDSPSEALSRPRCEQPSPTPGVRARPTLSRANEGRKISAGSINRWRADGKGCFSETVLVAASPRETPTTVTADLAPSQSRPTLKDDQFVVHMPSAREPQPYAYPGRSPAEIEAFEYYRSKSRRTSGEGYNRRKPIGGRVVCDAIPKTSSGGRSAGSFHQSAAPGQVASSLKPYPDIAVVKRQARKQLAQTSCRGPPSSCGVEMSAMTFAPFTSPRTPASAQCETVDTLLRTVRVPGAFRDITPECTRLPMGSANATSGVDLSNLPPIRLVPPGLASLPQSARVCSLGCERGAETGNCVNKDRSTPTSRSSLLRDTSADPKAGDRNGLGDHDLLLRLLAACMNAGRHLQLSKLDVLSALTIADATPQQKVDGLKSLIHLLGQSLLFLSALAMLWRLGTAIHHVVEMLLWPFAVPFKILRWLAGR